jgi:N-acetylmuramoyl-L-alanine amidase
MAFNIILDYGHGGLTPEGIYTTAPAKMHTFPNGEVAYEGVINRQIGGILEMFFRSQIPALNVVSTVSPTDPRDISLAYRVGVANRYPANESLFISVHSNAFNGQARGFEIYTTRGVTKSDTLADKIAGSVEHLYDPLQLKLRYDFSDSDKDKESDFYVLRKTNCPAVLLECLFFDNWEDFCFLRDPEFQKELAWRVYLGTMEYLSL